MTEVPDASERYLRQLGEGLQALGPEESAEIVQEVRSHLAEATAEAGGDLDVALARFGSPDDLAKKILEERGILVENPAVPPAAGWRRAVALSFPSTCSYG